MTQVHVIRHEKQRALRRPPTCVRHVYTSKDTTDTFTALQNAHYICVHIAETKRKQRKTLNTPPSPPKKKKKLKKKN